MFLKNTTTSVLDIITSAAQAIDVSCSFADLNASTGAFAGADHTNTAISTANTTTVVAAPGTTNNRSIKTVFIRHKGSAACDVTIRSNDNGTAAELYKVTMNAGDALSYIENVGWVYIAVATPNTVTKALSADQSNSTTTLTAVSGLTVTVGPGTYRYSYYITYQAAATTTGVRFSVNHTGTVTSFVAQQEWVDASATASTAAPTQAGVGAAGQCVGAMSARAVSNAGWSTTISVDTANADMLMKIEGTIVVTVSGNLELWHGSEVAAQSTVKAGSNLVLTRVA